MTGARVRQRARIALSTSTLLVLTLAAHASASGTLPGLVPTALVTMLAVAFSVAVSTRSRGVRLTFAYLLGVEALLHVVLTFAGSHAHGPEAAATPSMPAMVAGHVLAALAAAIVLRHADGVIERWCGLIAHALGAVRPMVGAADVTSCRLAPVVTTPQRLSVVSLMHDVARRGPPTRFAVLITA